jgi:hypothetical protein
MDVSAAQGMTMADNIDNLLLEHLKRFQVTLERVERELRDLKVRQTETHAAILGLRRNQSARC